MEYSLSPRGDSIRLTVRLFCLHLFPSEGLVGRIIPAGYWARRLSLKWNFSQLVESASALSQRSRRQKRDL